MAIHDVTGRKSEIQVKIHDENYRLKFSGGDLKITYYLDTGHEIKLKGTLDKKKRNKRSLRYLGKNNINSLIFFLLLYEINNFIRNILVRIQPL